MTTKQYCSYEHVHQLTLKTNIYHEIIQYDFIIGIGRGGLLPATILSHHNNIPMLVITASSYNDEAQNETVTITGLENITHLINGKRVLLVDDLHDSGKTLNECVRRIRSCQVAYVSVFVLHWKMKKNKILSEEALGYQITIGEFIPDMWMVYPWEQTVEYQIEQRNKLREHHFNMGLAMGAISVMAGFVIGSVINRIIN